MPARNANAIDVSGPGRRDAEIASAHLAQMLDIVGDVVIVMSRDRRIRYCNRAAEEFLARKRPLRVMYGRIGCATGPAEVELGRAVDAVCAPDGPGTVPIALRQSAPFPVLLLVKCLDDARDNVLLLAADNRPLGVKMVRPLRDYFGLTRSEALVAAAIAEGKSIATIAAERSVAVGTIRSQVKMIAAKLGCTRQTQIGAIVRSIPYASL